MGQRHPPKSTNNMLGKEQAEMTSLLHELGVSTEPTTSKTPKVCWMPIVAATMTALCSGLLIIGVCVWLISADPPASDERAEATEPAQLMQLPETSVVKTASGQTGQAADNPPTAPIVQGIVQPLPPEVKNTEAVDQVDAAPTEPNTPAVVPSEPEMVPVPAQIEPAKEEAAEPKNSLTLKRIRNHDIDELREQLAKFTELSLDPHQKRAEILELARFAVQNNNRPDRPLPNLLKRKFPGLPFTDGPACQLSAESAKTLDVLSKKLNQFMAESSKPILPVDGVGPVRNPKLVAVPDPKLDVRLLRERLLEGKEGLRQEWQRPEAVPTLEQILQVKDERARRLYVEIVRQIRGHRATEALARRAVFDLSPVVREEAVRALAERQPEEYRDILLAGLRYPWAPAAEHAAEAIAALKLIQLLPQLVVLLDEPNPAAPKADDRGQAHVREVVKFSHVRNCALCHPISHDPTDMVRGLVPPQFGESAVDSSAFAGYGGGSSLSVFVRADITYLRQDFSVEQRVLTNHKASQVRFDYLVRTRPATPAEVQAWQAKRADDYPQRQAVLFALRELTGQDAGEDAAAWRARIAQR